MAEIPVQVVILAAGQGKRMYSNLPKVLHPVAGKALALHVIDTARGLGAEKLVVVYGHGGEEGPAFHWGNLDSIECDYWTVVQNLAILPCKNPFRAFHCKHVAGRP